VEEIFHSPMWHLRLQSDPGTPRNAAESAVAGRSASTGELSAILVDDDDRCENLDAVKEKFI
jgi:hypothetical protein